MSDIALGRQGPQNTLFRGRTVALLLAIGIAGFAAMLVLGAYAPDLRSGRNGGAHALSNAVTGYSALVKLTEATGRHPRILRDPRQFDTEDLLVVTPESRSQIKAVLETRASKPTLIILPKWRTVPDEKHGGWARYQGLLPLVEPVNILASACCPTIMKQYRSGGGWLTSHGDFGRFYAPRPIQVIIREAFDGDWELIPLITDKDGGIVLAQVGEGPLYVLADPDLLNNRGMKELEQAQSALALLDWMNSTGNEGIAFDVSMNGFGHSRSPLKLLFEPPFLAMTLTIVAALLLTGCHALGRFGPLRPRERAIALGKTALVDNSALLIRKAGREARLGGRYAAAVRDRAARAFGVPARLRDGALDDYLDGLKGRHRFTDLAGAAEAATDRHSLLDAAQALHDWQQEKTE